MKRKRRTTKTDPKQKKIIIDSDDIQISHHQPIYPYNSKMDDDYDEMIFVFFLDSGKPIWNMDNIFRAFGKEYIAKVKTFKGSNLFEYADKHCPIDTSNHWVTWKMLLTYLKKRFPECVHRYGWWTGKEEWAKELK